MKKVFVIYVIEKPFTNRLHQHLIELFINSKPFESKKEAKDALKSAIKNNPEDTENQKFIILKIYTT